MHNKKKKFKNKEKFLFKNRSAQLMSSISLSEDKKFLLKQVCAKKKPTRVLNPNVIHSSTRKRSPTSTQDERISKTKNSTTKIQRLNLFYLCGCEIVLFDLSKYKELNLT